MVAPPGRQDRSRRVLGLASAAALVLLVGSVVGGERADDGRRAAATGLPPEAGAFAAPTVPPARICGARSLQGPSTPPGGAVVVRRGQNLRKVVDRARAGSTFWLEPGVHRLTRARYDQVTPKAGDTFVGAPGAVLDGQRRNLYAFTGTAPRVTIEHLTIQNFGGHGDNPDQGVVNHDSGHGWVVRHNTVRRNAGAGVFLGSHNVVSDNCLAHNGQYGFSAYEPGGVRSITLRRNEIVGNNAHDWEAAVPGCGCSGGGKFWETTGARVVANWVHDNRGAGLWADTNNSDFLIAGNLVEDNDAEGLLYETSYNAAIVGNTFARNALVSGPKNPGFPTPAIYISESGSDPRVDGRFGEAFHVAHNRFVDNWSGVVAWENADRFAGSPANTSTGVSTLVNPSQATVRACANPALVRQDPWYDDCRWKVQHLRVHHNTFVLDPARIESRCTAATGCGFVGLFSNWGTYPPWSPYQALKVADAITFAQDNLFSHNSYVGPWHFMVHEHGDRVSWRQWRGRPYRQDPASTLDAR
jgi:hypothetical protein